MRARHHLAPCTPQESKGKKYESVCHFHKVPILKLWFPTEPPDSSVMSTIPKARPTASGFKFCVQNIPEIPRFDQKLSKLKLYFLFTMQPDVFSFSSSNVQVPVDEVCGCPLVKNVFELTGDYCRVSKRKCNKHYNWEKLRRAEVDLERVRVVSATAGLWLMDFFYFFFFYVLTCNPIPVFLP